MFSLRLKKRTPVEFTLDRTITRIQEVHDFDFQFGKQVKAFNLLGQPPTHKADHRILFLRLS